MKTKQEIFESHFYSGVTPPPGTFNAMDEYAKEVAVPFAEFARDFQYNEQKIVSRKQKKTGVYSWVGRSYASIYDFFLMSLKVPPLRTMDNLLVYAGQEYWFWNESMDIIGPATHDGLGLKGFVRFRTREEAIEFEQRQKGADWKENIKKLKERYKDI